MALAAISSGAGFNPYITRIAPEGGEPVGVVREAVGLIARPVSVGAGVMVVEHVMDHPVPRGE